MSDGIVEFGLERRNFLLVLIALLAEVLEHALNITDNYLVWSLAEIIFEGVVASRNGSKEACWTEVGGKEDLDFVFSGKRFCANAVIC